MGDCMIPSGAASAGRLFFVGHEAAGKNLAGLYALAVTCEANGVNPEAYLDDVLLRVQTHPLLIQPAADSGSNPVAWRTVRPALVRNRSVDVVPE